MCKDNNAATICSQTLSADMYYAKPTSYIQQKLELCALTRIKLMAMLAKANIPPQDRSTHGLRWLGPEDLLHPHNGDNALLHNIAATNKKNFVGYIVEGTMMLPAATNFPGSALAL